MPTRSKPSPSPERYVALLRGVNVGGHKRVAMTQLRAFATQLGFTDVRSVLQSGNLVFGAVDSAANVERRLESESEPAFGFRVEFFVRTRPQWAALVRDNPFAAEATSDPAHLLAMPMKDEPEREDVADLRLAVTGSERIAVVGTCAYVVYPDGIGRSKLTNAVLDRALRTRGTARNWNTVLKLLALAHE